MKTVLIWDQMGLADIQFAIVDGDWSRFNGIYINHIGELSSELCDLVYPKSDSGECSIEFLEDFPYEEVKNGSKVVVCGFAP